MVLTLKQWNWEEWEAHGKQMCEINISNILDFQYIYFIYQYMFIYGSNFETMELGFQWRNLI